MAHSAFAAAGSSSDHDRAQSRQIGLASLAIGLVVGVFVVLFTAVGM